MRKLITIGINTLQGFATPAFNFLIVIFGVKFFGKTDWAHLINVMLWVFFTTFILGWGNRDYLLRTYSEKPNKMYHSFFSNFLSRCLLLPIALLLLLFFPLKIAICAITLVILTFTYASLSTLVVYHQKFGAQLLAEALAFFIIIGSVFYVNTFNLFTFLIIYSIAISIKLITLSLQLSFWKEAFSANISINEFKHGLPFFILGLSGWLISKTDIYAVSLFLEKSQLSEYQLLITAFLMLQALASYITIPFTKHIYRAPKQVTKKIKLKLYSIALPTTTIGASAIWLIMEYFVILGFSYEYYIIGGLIALPCFFYTLDIIKLMKSHLENIIIYISLFGFLINIISIYLLINSHELLGLLISACITQWMVLFAYKLTIKLKL